VDGVAQVHDLHVWQIGALDAAVSAHVLVRPNFDCHAVGAELRTLLAQRHHLEHATLQLDHSDGPADIVDRHCIDSHGPVHSTPEPTVKAAGADLR
ncbi:MAG: cation transporter, partial [Actinobacteria bacterium]|nr:cation transporter [Actinomycetota bacterium]